MTPLGTASRGALARCLTLLVGLLAPSAFAFPWMVKHHYGACGSCHVDPSGGGQTTAYGRAQADVLVRWKAQRPPPGEEAEVPRSANFLWFLELPEALNLSGNVRVGEGLAVALQPGAQVASLGAPVGVPLLMATDLYATVAVDRFVFHGTGGFGVHSPAAVVAPRCTSPCGPSFVAREFWAGLKLADEAVTVRLGRLNLPFGLRNAEHTSWVRAPSHTRTDLNTAQQVGLAVAYNSETLRGEVMGIAGNFQLGPDVYRERGYSAFAELTLAPSAYIGLSSLVTTAGADAMLGTSVATLRHAHGLFARYAPTEALALLAEVDFLAWVARPQLDRLGFAALLQADWEPVVGLHLIGLLEAAHAGAQVGPSLGAWASVAWYFAPHCELRVDNLVRRSSAGAPATYTLLAQLHFFL